MISSSAQGDIETQEMGLSVKPDDDHHHHHYGARVRERLRSFLHPNGRTIHVAASPEEAASLRRRLEQIHSNEDFDVYISGTPEHLDALRTAQSHHENRREELRQQHREVYARFESVRHEIDALANELDRVTTHGVALEAHFNRFGYSVHVRSYDDESPSVSGVTTPRSSTHGKQDSPSERGFATSLKLFKVPTLRQYFHKGILWRASGADEVQSFELFVDLLYVGILQIQGDATSEDPTGLSLLHFLITFSLSYKIWNDVNLFSSWFETDDIFQRISVLFLLLCLFGYTTNIVDAFEHTYATLIGFYLTARLFMACYLVLVCYFIPMIRGITIWHICMSLVSAAIWIGSIHIEWPAQLGLIATGMFVDIFGPLGHLMLLVVSETVGGKAKEWFERQFEVMPAVNIEHRTERTNAFVSLVFGYTVVALLYQSARNGIDAFFGKAVLGLVQCFIFNWTYFEIDSSNLLIHAIRRHKASAFTWTFVHLPFIMAFVLGGGGLARLVVANDAPNSHSEWLTETYRERSEDHIPDGIRWFYCCGFGLALISMAIISISHVHKQSEGIRLTKKFRLSARIAVAIVFICLPLVHDLNSLQLVGIITGLMVLLLVGELWSASSCHEKLVGRDKVCEYTGRCSKGILKEMIKGGREVDIDGLITDKEKDGGHVVGP
ncbi:low temperature requirement A [Lecanosticta acicola]|uniref:Low temperature requirement A n=1 Tax=Lecanosticta acicola TaxID=111012 RepID=A0AAI8Z052_9PEZI|nr:low temperature requirement A [Lecanosticta acicola]